MKTCLDVLSGVTFYRRAASANGAHLFRTVQLTRPEHVPPPPAKPPAVKR